jgi:hypothetical protein
MVTSSLTCSTTFISIGLMGSWSLRWTRRWRCSHRSRAGTSLRSGKANRGLGRPTHCDIVARDLADTRSTTSWRDRRPMRVVKGALSKARRRNQ